MSAARGIPRQAVILVGGEGTRLRPVTSRVPKPVAPVVERPFVAYILDNLARHGVERAVFSTGFLAEAIEAEIGDGAGYGLEVDYAVEEEPLGTAGAIANCDALLDDGASSCSTATSSATSTSARSPPLHAAKGGMGTIFLTPVDDPRRYGLVELREDGAVASFLEKPGEWEGTALINAGVYVLEPEVLEMIPRGRLFSIERGVFPKLAQAGSLYGYVDHGYWRDIGTPDSYLQAHFDILERHGATRRSPTSSASSTCTSRRRPRSRRGRASCRRATSPTASAWAPARGSARWPCSAPAPWSARAPPCVEAVVQAGVVIGAHAQVEGSILVQGSQHRRRDAAERRRPRRGLRGRRRQPARRRHLRLPGHRAARQLHPVLRAAARQGGHMTIPDGIFKAYDIRGLYPQELDEAAAERIGCALAQQLGAAAARRGHGPAAVVHRAARGVRRRRRRRAAPSTVDFGLVPTEMLYFGVASRGLDGGAMVTASHNPPQYNGMKLVGGGRAAAERRRRHPRAQGAQPGARRAAGARRRRRQRARRPLPGLRRAPARLVDVAAFRPYKVVMDAANGVAGKLAPLVFDGTPLDCVEMYFEVDGTFPNHEPNPLLEENSREIRERVVAEKADLGIAWDGDADRCFFIDEDGEFVPGDFVTALLAEALLLKHPGASDPLRPARQPRRARRDHAPTAACRCSTASGTPSSSSACAARAGCSAARSPATTTSPTTTTPTPASSRRCSSSSCSRARRRRWPSCSSRCARSTSSAARSTPPSTTCRAALARIEERFADGEMTKLDGISVDYDRLALQRAPVQHRAAAAPQPRRRLAGAHGGEARPRALRHPRGLTWATPTDLGPARAAELDRGRHARRDRRPAAAAARGLRGRARRPRRRVLRDVPGHPAGRPTGLVVCGMGGSAIGADLVLACLPEPAACRPPWCAATRCPRGSAPRRWSSP